MSWHRATLLEGVHQSLIGKPADAGGFNFPAVVAHTVDVGGERIPLYRMTGGRHPWPARADVVRLLGGFTCSVLDGGTGLDHLAVPGGRLPIVSPRAVAIAIGFALRAGRIAPARADALLRAVGEHPES